LLLILSGKLNRGSFIIMKIKVISRDEEEYTRERNTDLRKVYHNLHPSLHPFEKPREYVRALNAVKMDKIFAKPFVNALSGHIDGVFSLIRHPLSLNTLISGACDGEIRIWNIANSKTTWKVVAHSGYVRGLAADSTGSVFISCGEDKKIKVWSFSNDANEISQTPQSIIRGEHAFRDVDHQIHSTQFATCGNNIVSLWDRDRSEPTHTYTWGHDTVYRLKFNPIETNILASCMSDRGIVFIDTRQGTGMQKLILKMKSNSLAWNPREAYIFTAASEDYNLYTFDMRKLNRPLQKHEDHVSAVLDVDYSPTGKEFVSGSYDHTIRIFPFDLLERNRSREVYHTERMQRIFCAKFSGDGQFVLSGSSDTNIRVWKTNASIPLRPMERREKEKIDYLNNLKDKYKALPEVRSIAHHRQVNKFIHTTKRKAQIGWLSQKRKEARFLKRLPVGNPLRTKQLLKKKGFLKQDVVNVLE